LEQWSIGISRYKYDARDISQRTRGFLYGCIAATVASRLGIPDIQLADNGVVSLNLPINDQLIGALASRTTHPMFIRRFNNLLVEVFSEAPRVRNPLWNQTRAEALGFLKESGYEDLLQETVSCSRSRGRPRIQPQCGYCFQCVDRRFATVAAGLEEHDLAERYGIDIFSHELAEGEARTVATSYVRFAQELELLDEATLFLEFPQLIDCIDREGDNLTSEAESLAGMLHRHAVTVLGVLESQITTHRATMVRGELPPHSLLRLVSLKEQKEQSVPHSREETVEFNPSPDYRSIQLRGQTYHLSPFQAAAVKVLHEHHPSELSGSYILEQIEAASRSISDLFKGSEAWGKLIVPGNRRGSYRLNL
jgi:hypothetical protein